MIQSMRYRILLLLLLLSSLAAAGNLKPFTTDGCSLFPDGSMVQNTLWLSCCRAHDVAYWQGGTYQQRLAADEKLRQCVRNVDEKEVAQIMWFGVRAGGTPYLPTHFRWGYGWPYPRGYKALTEQELQQVENLYPAPSE